MSLADLPGHAHFVSWSIFVKVEGIERLFGSWKSFAVAMRHDNLEASETSLG